MFELVRPVRWSDVDAAGIVYFPRFLEYCHDAIEALFGELEGGYAKLTQLRKIGVPSVHVEVNFLAPLRYGDVCRVRVHVEKIGRSSVTFRHVLLRDDPDDPSGAIVCCEVRHVVVVSDLVALKGTVIPDDVLAVLESHRDDDGT
jgi:4-hydroxybenzoyl-CoA thioesterase